jgi:MbtH protein
MSTPAPTPDHRVVRNDEDQYSVWPLDRDLPAGWHDAGHRGTRENCLEHVGRVWTDLRPASLRRRQGEAAAVEGRR